VPALVFIYLLPGAVTLLAPSTPKCDRMCCT